MADIFETVIGMAEPALKMVGGIVEDVQASVQKIINNAVAEALKASGAGAGSGAGTSAASAPPAQAASSSPPPASSAARVRPLRAPGR